MDHCEVQCANEALETRTQGESQQEIVCRDDDVGARWDMEHDVVIKIRTKDVENTGTYLRYSQSEKGAL